MNEKVKDLFEYDDYRAYIVDYLKNLPNRGYGQLAKIARAISLNPSTLTLILQNKKDFTPEQANDFCEHLEMTELETSFFMCLVALRRAGKPNLRSRIQKEIQSIRRKSKELKNRIPPKTELTEEAKAIFYSQWYYSGARLLTSIDGFNSAEKISERLQIPRITIKRVLEFLHSTGLCVEKNGQYKMGPQSTHLGTDSPLIARHHQNWRLKTIERANQISSHELIFTSPVSIATADIAKVKKVLMGAVEDCFKIIEPSSCKELACLNIDWFKV